MRIPERVYANLLVQILSVLLLSLYVYATRHEAAVNAVWLGVSLLLAAIGFLRKVTAALLSAFAAVFLYGAGTAAWLYVNDALADLSLERIVWVFVFPLFALIGGLNQLDRASVSARIDEQAQLLYETESEESFTIDDRENFLNRNAFLYAMEDQTIRAVRGRYKFVLVLIGIESYKRYRRELGYEETGLALNRFAGVIDAAVPQNALKAYLGEGTFALTLLENEHMTAEEARERLDEEFIAYLTSRPRRETQFRLRFRYGTAECPADGIEAHAVIEKAEKELKSLGPSE